MKKKHKVLIVIIAALLILFIISKILLWWFDTNLKNLSTSEVSDVDMSSVADGNYVGSYSVFPVSAEVEVVIEDKAIKEIKLLKHFNGQGKDAEIIPGNVTNAQSLKVDSVSGATYSSKVILNAIRNALIKAGAKPISPTN